MSRNDPPPSSKSGSSSSSSSSSSVSTKTSPTQTECTGTEPYYNVPVLQNVVSAAPGVTSRLYSVQVRSCSSENLVISVMQVMTKSEMDSLSQYQRQQLQQQQHHSQQQVGSILLSKISLISLTLLTLSNLAEFFLRCPQPLHISDCIM